MIDVRTDAAREEATALRRTIRDLAALAALPAIWASSDLSGSLQNVAEALVAAVRARFVFIRVTAAPGEILDVASVNSVRARAELVQELRGHLSRHLDLSQHELPETIPAPEEGSALRLSYCHVSLEGHGRGMIIACSPLQPPARDYDQVLLHTGAAQVAILLQRHEIEKKRQAEALKLERQSRSLEGLNQAGTALVAELDLEKIVQRVTDIGREISGAAFGAFFYNVQNERGESYTLYTLSGAPREAFSKFPMPRNTAIFNPTFTGECVVRIGDVRKDPRFGKNAPHHGMPKGHLPVVSYLAVPVKSRTGDVLGGLFYGHPEADVFSAEAERALVALAAQAAIAIDNSHLYAALQRELARARQGEEANRRLALIVQSSDDAIVAKDLNSIITSWNPGAERLFGYSAEEMIGRPIYVLIPPDRHHEEADIINRIRRGERVEHYETVRRTRDGRLVDVALTISPLRTASGEVVGASKIARDITEKRRSESQRRALYELAERVNRAAALPEIFDAALQSIRHCHEADRASILLFDAAGVMRFVAACGLSEDYQRAVEGHSPWKRDEPDPKPVCIDDVAAIDLDPHLRAVIEREGIKALAFIPLTYEKRLLGKFMVYFDRVHRFLPGELRPVETIASQVAFAIERRKSAAELESLVAERTLSLRKAIEQMEEFSYSVSHDLRSPVRAMRGYAEAVLQDYSAKLDDQGRDLLGRIQRGGARMDRLIQDLLTYTRLARREIKADVVSLDRLVREVIQHYPEMGPEVATVEINGRLPDVLAHEPSLTQVISNLLSNAVKFVPPGKRPHVRVGAERSAETVRLWFEDNGIGIQPEYQDRLFRMFERIHQDKAYEGTGIGLAIVRKAIERMNGTAGVISDGA
ncbi:MAG TPA: PAS domain S-box protein, partial [Opitutaceae bacterium]|nr:PAS domain S-box protein [Opitutaceae bacterium]